MTLPCIVLISQPEFFLLDLSQCPMDGETSMDTEPLAAPPTTVEDVQRLQKDLSSLSRELSDLDSQIELRQELASLLTEGTKEKLSKLRLKKRKRDGVC
jgi:hypothetical protein